ncbi:MAG TPA: hypothetical protein VGO56_05380 [Pyrinomonadaceae bacterium]|jgi:hypothetical protein|nr:hypothetical protein [Pyrinomonadaceae bacterium]
MLRFRTNSLAIFSLVLLVALVSPAQAQKKDPKEKKVYTGTPVLWHAPEDIESRNLLLGAGGEAMKPDLSRVTFVEDKEGGWSTKYRVRDGKGVEWVAKLSKEAQPETAANRLAWAAGYETEIVYLVPELEIVGKGTFKNVKLEARPKDVKRTGFWQWESNPFRGKAEFQGLKIMMALINNWDMKDDNNAILAVKGDTNSERRFIISDLGATFGKTGGVFSRSRNKPSDFVKAEFVKGVKGSEIDFNYSGKNQKIFDGITVADAKWLADWLSRLSDDQIGDAFRAANYSTEEVEMLTGAVRTRINTLTSLVNGR